MDNNILIEYGLKLIEKLELDKKRKVIQTNTMLTEYDDILLLIKQYINLDSYTIISSHKNNTIGYSMKPHVDDCQKVVCKTILHNEMNYTHIQKNIYLYHTKIPKYSIIYYSSEYDKDFTGGKLIFADKTEILPTKGLLVIFDSREVHYVTPIIKGNRESWLFKLYE